MQYLNALGVPMVAAASEMEMLAWLEVNENLTVVYQRDKEQIGILVRQLKKEAEELGKDVDAKYFDEEYWLTAACTKSGGRCQGSCSSGSCQECCLKSCYCCCR